MVQKLFTLCQVETKRLIWILGLCFATVFVFQYFELPYGTSLSVFSTAQLPVLEKSSNLQDGDSPSNSGILGNMSLSNGSNQTGTNVILEIANNASTYLGLDEDNNDSKESYYIKLENKNKISIPNDVEENVENEYAPEEARRPEQNSKMKFDTSYSNSNHVGNSVAGFASNPPPIVPQINSLHYASPIAMDTYIITPTISDNSSTSLAEKDRTTTLEKNEKSERLHSDLKQIENTSSTLRVAEIIRKPKVWQKKPPKVVFPIFEMNNMLLQSRASYYSVVC